MSQQLADHRDVARLPIVGGAHDGDVLAGEAKARHDPGAKAGDRLERLGTGAEVGPAVGVPASCHHAAVGVAGGQMAPQDSLVDLAPLHQDHGRGRIRH